MSPLMRLDVLEQFAAVNLLADPGLIPGPKLVDQCAQITLYWSLANGKSAHMVLGGRYTGAFAGTQAQANGILTGLSSGAQWTALAAFIATTTGFGNVSIRNIMVADQPLILSNATGGSGTSASPELPDETAAVITHRTALTGPRYRGRTYLAGFATNALATGNVIAAATITAINNWAATIAAVFAANGYTLCLALPARNAYTSPKTGRVFPARPKETPSVTQSTVRDNHWDTQRRRGLK